MVSAIRGRGVCFLVLTSLTWCSTAWAADAKAPAETTPEQAKQAKALFVEFKAAVDEVGRKAAMEKIIGLGGSAVALVSPVIDQELAVEEGRYGMILEPAIRSAYLKKLAAISDEQMEHILRTRALWQPYILNGGQDPKFREVFLAPIWKMKEILLLKMADIDEPQVAAARGKLVEYAGYQAQCHRVLGIDPDPTVGKRSPTGIEYAHLDQPPTFLDKLHHYERTLILINSVASPGAREVLLMADQAAREIDVQEAEYVMAANEVRMLAGSIAWRSDPLGCAVTRDHSTDRKEGRASGHMSDVPGKRGFTDRNKRMGAIFFGSEGAGGGNSGPAYLNGLSYSGDGHGGPLYRLARNLVGVGRRGGVYTSQYATDKERIHPCPASDNEMWMPPGITARDLRDGALQQAFKAMKAEAYASAQKLLGMVKSPTGADAIAMRFFQAAITARSAQAVADILALESSGDVFLAKVTLNDGLAKYKGIQTFETGVAETVERLAAKELRSELRAGEAYHRLYDVVKDLPKDQFDLSRPDLIKRLNTFAHKFKDSVYGQAAADAATRLAVPESDAKELLAFFRGRQTSAQTVDVTE